MKTVTLVDKTFGLSHPESEILAAIDKIAEEMQRDLHDKKPIFLVVLNGAYMFASDLMKRLEFTAQLQFIKLSSYTGTERSQDIKELIGLTEEVKGRTVCIVEDIVDSGATMQKLVAHIERLGADDIKVCTLLSKPNALKYPVKLDYVALEIPNDFIVGYGLDYYEYGRNLRDIYTLIP